MSRYWDDRIRVSDKLTVMERETGHIFEAQLKLWWAYIRWQCVRCDRWWKEDDMPLGPCQGREHLTSKQAAEKWYSMYRPGKVSER